MAKHGWVLFFVALVAAACGGRVTDNCQFCGDKCVDTKSDVYNCGGCGQTCVVGQTCVAGTCTSASPTSPHACSDPSLVDCGDGVCSDLVTDGKNCGGCGIDCGGGACAHGQCVDASCVADGASCSFDGDCCSSFCKSDGVCGCVATGSAGCVMDVDCCAPADSCNANGVCE